METYLKELLVLCLVVKGCSGEKRNFTIGTNTYEAGRAQEHVGDYEQCYVDIVVYNSTSLRYGLSNATVFVLAGPLEFVTLTFSEGLTDASGHTCIPVKCRDEARIFVEKNSVRLTALNETVQKKNLPRLFYMAFETGNEVIKFFVNAWGTIGGRSGPVYSTKEKQKCNNASALDYHFSFSYLSIPAKLMSTPVPPTINFKDPDFHKAWYYGRLSSEIRYCYFKVKIRTNSHQSVIRAYSKSRNGTVYGLFQTGFWYDVNSVDTVDQAACVEFRCPAEDIFGRQPPMVTSIEGTIEIPGHKDGCCVKNSEKKLFKVSPKNFSTISPLKPGSEYGSSYGIYMNTNKDIARLKCFTGHEILVSEYAMNPNSSYAFEYDCLVNVDCSSLPNPIIGK